MNFVTPLMISSVAHTSLFQLSKLHHPDVNPNDGEAAQKFLEISGAYNVLGNDFTRYVSTFIDRLFQTPLYAHEFDICWPCVSRHRRNPFYGANTSLRYSALLESRTVLCWPVQWPLVYCDAKLALVTYVRSPPIRQTDPNLIGETMTAEPTRRLRVLVHLLASGATHQHTHAQSHCIMQQMWSMPGKPRMIV